MYSYLCYWINNCKGIFFSDMQKVGDGSRLGDDTKLQLRLPNFTLDYLYQLKCPSECTTGTMA